MNQATRYIAASIIAQTSPNNSLGILHQGNWPTDAEFGVEYRFHDKQFPSVDHGFGIEYFSNHDQLLDWLEKKREFVAGTDHDFTMEYKVYEWDLGPMFKYFRTI